MQVASGVLLLCTSPLQASVRRLRRLFLCLPVSLVPCVLPISVLTCPPHLLAPASGRLGIVDHDVVDVSNLHRQVAHTEARAGMSKAESAKATALAVNSSITVDAVPEKLSSANAMELVSGYDAVIDATDNPGTRYMLNDACVLARVPLVSGAALGMDGQLSVYNCRGGPCYRCVFPDPPARATFTSCSDGGVLGPVPGLIGVQQAVEAIKVVTGVGEPLVQRLLVYNAEDSLFRVVKLRKRSPECVVCGDAPTITSLADTDEFCACNDVPAVEGAPEPRTDDAAAAMSVTCAEYRAVQEAGTPYVRCCCVCVCVCVCLSVCLCLSVSVCVCGGWPTRGVTLPALFPHPPQPRPAGRPRSGAV